MLRTVKMQYQDKAQYLQDTLDLADEVRRDEIYLLGKDYASVSSPAIDGVGSGTSVKPSRSPVEAAVIRHDADLTRLAKKRRDLEQRRHTISAAAGKMDNRRKQDIIIRRYLCGWSTSQIAGWMRTTKQAARAAIASAVRELPL